MSTKEIEFEAVPTDGIVFVPHSRGHSKYAKVFAAMRQLAPGETLLVKVTTITASPGTILRTIWRYHMPKDEVRKFWFRSTVDGRAAVTLAPTGDDCKSITVD